MKNSELMEKFKEICKRHRIRVRRIKSGPNRANSKQKTVWIREITDPGGFAAALHEIGHAMCDPDNPPQNHCETLDVETNAWRWALDHNGDKFDAAGWKRLHESLHHYYVSVMNPAHPAHALLVRAEQHVPTIRCRVSSYGAPGLTPVPKKTSKPQP